MYFLKFDNENIFVESKNKIILTNYNSYFKFMNQILKINDNKNEFSIELNGLKLTNKNTLIIDFTSISSIVKIFNNNNNRIIDEYINIQLDNILIESKEEEIINNTINKILNRLYSEIKNDDAEIDLFKILKSQSNIQIKNSNDLLKIINSIIKSDNIKQIIVLYKNSLLNHFKFQEIKTINNDKLILFEICDKESSLEVNNNILIFDDEIFQITYNDFMELICKKINNYSIENKELYEYLINKILFYSINKKEVDIMKKHINEIEELCNILVKEFKLNLKNTLDYI